MKMIKNLFVVSSFIAASLSGLPNASAQESQKTIVSVAKTTVSRHDAAEYPDVPANHWAAQAVNYISALGAAEGYQSGLFHGDKPMTRYEWAVSQARIHVHRYGLTRPEQELRNDVNQILKRLEALEERFSTLEKKLNTVSAHGEGIHPEYQATRHSSSEAGEELKELGADLKGVAAEAVTVARNVMTSPPANPAQ